ncbi:hypothetical protein [Natranaerofaba carboxydovora]|uniref:hypothetical protein n=1 Tax=Natranaerofaba carboxydovora TaxID=2742683 RepID=UPI001F12DD52|nr:hypothetical protein [Natranaerofaba carboxydovora]UMZ72908.1 hypothetical protein ACONDI_00446 [Natranaerofaba carboxydovora]
MNNKIIEEKILLADYKNLFIKFDSELSNEEKYKLIIDEIISQSKVEIPESKVVKEMENTQKDIGDVIKYHGTNIVDYLSDQGVSLTEYKDFLREKTTRKLSEELILEKIAKQENLLANDSEVDKAVQELAQKEKIDKESSYEILKISNQLEVIKRAITINKVKTYLIDLYV